MRRNIAALSLQLWGRSLSLRGGLLLSAVPEALSQTTLAGR